MNMDLRHALRIYQFAERLKSELIIGNNLIQETSMMEDNVSGGKKILTAYLNAVLLEANLAVNTAHSPFFVDVARKVGLAVDETDLANFSGASRAVTEALALSTSAAGEAAQVLIDNEML
ncbi:MAG: hypothetical protein ACE5IJ_02055 [Thermoplasmata archaeon]